jgi:dienelactone hydrolase
MKILQVFLLLLFIVPTTSLFAAVLEEPVTYLDGDVTLEGYLIYDDSISGQRPGVAVFHAWKGLDDYAKGRAHRIAEMGYVAFAVDMYGKGVRAQTHEEAAQLSGIYFRDRALMRTRAQAGLQILQKHSLVDPNRIAAIGYCFGGTTVVEIARSGADVAGVVSFHGVLDSLNPKDAFQIKGRVLVFHGTDDPYVPPENMVALNQEMQAADVDFRVVNYPGTVHSFTTPGAGNDPSSGSAYDALADQDSWEQMKKFFAEIFLAQD